MKTKILGLLAVGLMAGPMAAQAVVYQFSLAANGDVGPVEIRYTTNNFVPIGGLSVIALTDPGISYSSGTPVIQANSVIGFDQDPTETLFGLYLERDPAGVLLFNVNYPLDFFAFTRTFDQEGTFSSTRGLVRSDLSLQTRNPVATLCVSSTGACDQTVPEPGTLALLGLGLAGLGLSRRRKAH